MKKIVILLILCALLLSGCSSTGGEGPTQSQGALPGESETSNQTEPSEESTEEVAYEITYSSAITYKNSIGTVWVQSIFVVENTGTVPLYMSSGAYDLEDADGNLIASRTMVSVYPSVIAPGEKAYYYEETTLDDLTDPIELDILPRPTADKAKVDMVRNTLTDIEITADEYSGVSVKGRVENNTAETQSMTYIAIILFDSGDIPIGMVTTILMEDLAPGDKFGFETSGFSLPDTVTVDAVARHEAYAYPMQMQF